MCLFADFCLLVEQQLKLILTAASNDYYRFVTFYLCIMFLFQKIFLEAACLDKLDKKLGQVKTKYKNNFYVQWFLF